MARQRLLPAVKQLTASTQLMSDDTEGGGGDYYGFLERVTWDEVNFNSADSKDMLILKIFNLQDVLDARYN